jgi:hypothetical protein
MRLVNTFFSFILLIVSSTYAQAAPGAHGPGGEHLDGAVTTHGHQNSGPRIETFTELFELVGRLEKDELSVLVDRYQSNEPVLNGQLEVEFNGVKAKATFHKDNGDYSFDDANLLKLLSKPGAHALLFTLTVGNESDLLEGTLNVIEAANSTTSAKAASDHAHSRFEQIAWVAGGLVILASIAVLFVRRRNLLKRKFA